MYNHAYCMFTLNDCVLMKLILSYKIENSHFAFVRQYYFM